MRTALRALACCGVLSLLTGFALAEGDVLSIETGSFSMRFGAAFQFQGERRDGKYEYSGDYFTLLDANENVVPFANTTIEPKTDFSIPLARLTVSGHAFFPFLNYYIETELGQPATGELYPQTSTPSTPRLTDAWVALNFSDALNWRLGQFKVPFDMFALQNERYRMFAGLPNGTLTFAPGRDIGVAYHGNAHERQFNWYLALMNGGGDNRPGNDNSKFLVAARVEYQNKGGFRYRATAADHPSSLEWTAGLSFLSNPRNTTAGLVDETGAGCVPGYSNNCAYQTSKESAGELFGAIRGSRWQVNGTLQKWTFDDAAYENLDPSAGGRKALKISYFNVDGGYFVTDKIEIAARFGQWKFDDPAYLWDGTFTQPGDPPWESFDPQDITFVGSSAVKQDEWRLGVNYYLAGHNAKFMLDLGQEKKTVDKVDPVELGGYGTGTSTFTVKGVRAMFAFFI